MAKTETTCTKCNGTGYLRRHANIANGTCFGCAGNGTVMVDLTVKRSKLNPETVKRAEFIMNSTEETWESDYWTWEKISAVDKFAHAGDEVRRCFPGMHKHWCEVGRWKFFQLQEEKRREWEIANG